MFENFTQNLAAQRDLPAYLRRQLIGDNTMIDGPFGPQKMVYADYVASGRALRVIEDFVAEEVLPYYANSHTRASYCGEKMTAMREAGRAEIAPHYRRWTRSFSDLHRGRGNGGDQSAGQAGWAGRFGARGPSACRLFGAI